VVYKAEVQIKRHHRPAAPQQGVQRPTRGPTSNPVRMQCACSEFVRAKDCPLSSERVRAGYHHSTRADRWHETPAVKSAPQSQVVGGGGPGNAGPSATTTVRVLLGAPAAHRVSSGLASREAAGIVYTLGPGISVEAEPAPNVSGGITAHGRQRRARTSVAVAPHTVGSAEP